MKHPGPGGVTVWRSNPLIWRRHRRIYDTRIVVATHNAQKLDELRQLLSPWVEEVIPAESLGLAAPDISREKGFFARASLKARAAAEAAGIPALADEGGLLIDILLGADGTDSQTAAEQAPYLAAAAQHLQRVQSTGVGIGAVEASELEQRLAASNDRRARLSCVIALAWPDGHCETFQELTDGEIVLPPRGDVGFGSDAIFVPRQYCFIRTPKTFAEDSWLKRSFGPRARAVQTLANACLRRSVVDEDFHDAARAWLTASNELFVVLRHPFAGGGRDYAIVRSKEHLDRIVERLRPMTDVMLFRQPQLTLRGPASSDALRQAAAMLAAQAATERRSLLIMTLDEGEVLPVPNCNNTEWGLWSLQNQVAEVCDEPQLEEAFRDFGGSQVAIGPEPAWWDADKPDMISGLVPSIDGIAHVGVY